MTALNLEEAMRLANPLAQLIKEGQSCGACRHFDPFPPEALGAGWGEGTCTVVNLPNGRSSDLPVTTASGTGCLYFRRRREA